MEDLKETLTHKYGPLPGYAWVGIGAVGILLAARLHKSGAAPGNVTLQPASDGAGVTGPDLGGLDGGGGGGFGADPGTGDGSAVPPPSIIAVTPPSSGSGGGGGDDLHLVTTTSEPGTPTAPPPPSTVLQIAPPPAPVQSSNPQVQAKLSGVPVGSTATSLQKTVAKPSAKTVYPKTSFEDHPVAVKVTANPSGASANKTQGVFSIH